MFGCRVDDKVLGFSLGVARESSIEHVFIFYELDPINLDSPLLQC